VLGYGRPYRWSILGMLLITLAIIGLSLLTPLIMRSLIDRVLPHRDLRGLLWLVTALLAIPLTNGVLTVVLRQHTSRVGEGVVFDLRTELFSHLQRMSLNFFTHTKVGEVMSRLNNDVGGAQSAITNTFVSIATNFIQAVAVLILMFTLDWRLTLISIAILPLSVFAARRLGNRLRDLARVQMDCNAKMNAVMHEILNINGALIVKLFGRTKEEDERFRARASDVRQSGINRVVTGSFFVVSTGLFGFIGVALVYGVGGFLVIRQAMTIGTIVALGAYLGSLYNAVQSLTNAPVDFATSIVSFERMFEVIDLPLEIAEKPEAIRLHTIRSALKFEDVSFSYKVDGTGLLKSVRRFGQMQEVNAVLTGDTPEWPREQNGGAEELRTSVHSQAHEKVLEHVSFNADPGRLVALVGPSGAGKTTLTYLIPRLYDPTAGRILLDGQDIRNLSLDTLSEAIGMVSQESYLFHDTIRTNLTYAKLDATQDEIEAAARVVNIHDFIMGLPNRYDTVVGERGYRLSGGEKQRLALARIILKDPAILVLDEATSSLDSQSEALIQGALKRVMAGRTSIVIAHRLSTILSADLILVLDRGRVVERGTHADLLLQGGLYSTLYETQFQRWASEPGNSGERSPSNHTVHLR
jgi:ATP-binding cassette subfamily B protein